jgi:hypothetical protein
MKAEEMFDNEEKFKSTVIQGYKNEVVDLMKTFAESKCEEQKRACFKEAINDSCYDSILYTKIVEM